MKKCYYSRVTVKYDIYIIPKNKGYGVELENNSESDITVVIKAKRDKLVTRLPPVPVKTSPVPSVYADFFRKNAITVV